MHRKYLLLTISAITIISLAGCNKLPDNDLLPPPPPMDKDFNDMRKKLDAACISGIMQTGSDIFKELTKNGTDKLEKLKFIRVKLQSIYNNSQNSDSKIQITNQLKGLDEMIKDMEIREEEVKSNPNIICHKTDELKKLNKTIKEKIMGLSGDINTIREHERRGGIVEFIKREFFSRKDNKKTGCDKTDQNNNLCPPIDPREFDKILQK